MTFVPFNKPVKEKEQLPEVLPVGQLVGVAKELLPVGQNQPQMWRGDITDTQQPPETYAGAGDLVLRRPENIEDMYKAYRLSAILGPIVNALTTNIYQAPHTFTPVDNLDLGDEEETRERLREYLVYMKAGGDLEADVEVTDEELDTEFKRFSRRVKNEALYLESWTKCAVLDMTFLQLRILTGQDLEIQASAFWEILRDAANRPSRIAWCPAWTMHAQPQENALRRVMELQPVTPIHWVPGEQLRRFRSYIQVDASGSVIAHFKEYGDPRLMSRKTGIYYPSLEAMQADRREVGALPATEILHFKLPSSSSFTYGKTDWSGAYPNAVGSRDLEEMNMKVITDQVIPQLMLLISGGRGVKKEDQQRVQEQIKQNIQDGLRGLYILHALPSTAPTGRTTDVTMHLERLKSEQHQDALGLSYLGHSKDTIRGSYRMPKVAVGDEEGINRSTASMMLRLVENQVYEPRRELFDDLLNSTLVRDLGIQCVRYRTQSRVPREPAEVADMLFKLMSVGVLAQEDGRAISEGLFGRQFKKAKGLWSKITPRILTALLQTKNSLVASALLSEDGDVEAKLREALERQLTSGGSEDEDSSGGPDVRSSGDDDEGGIRSEARSEPSIEGEGTGGSEAG